MSGITCQGCRRRIRREHISLETRIAKCLQCDAVFRIVEALPPRLALAGNREESLHGVSLRERSNSLTFAVRWFSLKRMLLLAIPLCVEGSLILAGEAVDQYLFAPIFVYLFSATICLASLYGMVCTLFNTTRVRVTDRYLKITHSPLPWAAQLELEADNIKQLYVPPVFTKHSKASRAYQYSVWALTSDGRRVRLLGSLRDRCQARFLERQIEDFLGIVDCRVPGEVV